MERIILHCDCNAFYASVELLEHPELKEVPVAVGGDDDSRHGIVLAKNEPAKACGVKTAQTLWQARQNCPNLVVLPPHRKRYLEFSKKINEIYGQYTDLVEPFGIDESWLDVTGSLHLFAPTGVHLANTIRNRIKRELGLTISVGVSYNKIYAKLGSDYKKPDATTLIDHSNERKIVWPMPVSNMIYVGRAVETQLRRLGIITLGQLACADDEILAASMGKLGPQLKRNAAGQNTDPVAFQDAPEEVKSVGNGMTFRRDLTSMQDIRTGCACLADEVASRLRRHGLYCGAVQVQIKGTDLKSISRQRTLLRQTDLGAEIGQVALELIGTNWPAGKPIRALTITAEHLSRELSPVQMDLEGKAPGPPDKRTEKLERTLDQLKSRFGSAAPGRGSRIGNDLGFADPAAGKKTPPGEKEPF